MGFGVVVVVGKIRRVMKMSEDETYEEKIYCPNCDYRQIFKIKKGISTVDFKRATKCSRCGCLFYDW